MYNGAKPEVIESDIPLVNVALRMTDPFGDFLNLCFENVGFLKTRRGIFGEGEIEENFRIIRTWVENLL